MNLAELMMMANLIKVKFELLSVLSFIITIPLLIPGRGTGDSSFPAMS